MPHQETIHILVEQIEQATRALDNYSYGPEHDRVRRYYTGLVAGGTQAPVALQRARCAVLFELLYQALPTCVEESHQLVRQEGYPFQYSRLENFEGTSWHGARYEEISPWTRGHLSNGKNSEG